MTEAEILFQYSEVVNRIWTLIQWWSGVSFGMIALAHLTLERLNRALLLVVLSLYTIYTILIYSVLRLNVDNTGDYVDDLRQLRAMGETLGGHATRLIESDFSILVQTLGWIIPMYVYIACVFYPIYAYKKHKNVSTNVP